MSQISQIQYNTVQFEIFFGFRTSHDGTSRPVYKFYIWLFSEIIVVFQPKGLS